MVTYLFNEVFLGKMKKRQQNLGKTMSKQRYRGQTSNAPLLFLFFTSAADAALAPAGGGFSVIIIELRILLERRIF